jgi:plasmid replication initiation protein
VELLMLKKPKLRDFSVTFTGLKAGKKGNYIRITIERKRIRGKDAYDAMDRMKATIPHFDDVMYPTFAFEDVTKGGR